MYVTAGRNVAGGRPDDLPVFHNGVAAVNISYADFVPERDIVQGFDPQDVRLPPNHDLIADPDRLEQCGGVV